MLIGGQVLWLGSSCTLESGNAPGIAYVNALAGPGGLLRSDGSTRSPCRLRSDVLGVNAVVSGALDALNAADGILRVFDVTAQAQFATGYRNLAGDAIESNEFRPGDTVEIGVLPTTTPGRGVASYVRRADPSIAGGAAARFEGFMTSPGPDRVAFLGRSILVDAGTRAGLRDCTTLSQVLQPTAVAPFVSSVFFRGGERWIAATVAGDGNGGWRAVTIEAYADLYCDQHSRSAGGILHPMDIGATVTAADRAS